MTRVGELGLLVPGDFDEREDGLSGGIGDGQRRGHL